MRNRSSFVTALFVAVLGLVVAAALPACGQGESTITAPLAANPDPGPGTDDDAGEPDASADDAAKPASCSSATCGAGCCAGGACKKSTSESCGTAGNACVSCKSAAAGHACLYGECGCSSNLDCADGDVCDPALRRCGKSCKTEPCAAGCCSPDGVCQGGKNASACGASGACADCKSAFKGEACVAGGSCGCNTAADCPHTNQACDVATHSCTSTCSPTQPCKGGCCENGTCGGQKKTACGGDGLACVDCTGNPAGNGCSFATKHCGCDSASDCAVGKACDTKTHICTDACSATQLCNGGCCSGTKCAAGDTVAACLFGSYAFNANGMCTACGAAARGTQCLPFGAGLHTCGCTADAQCGGGKVCKYKGLNSTNACCVPKDGFSGSAGGCCSGVSLNNICG